MRLVAPNATADSVARAHALGELTAAEAMRAAVHLDLEDPYDSEGDPVSLLVRAYLEPLLPELTSVASCGNSSLLNRKRRTATSVAVAVRGPFAVWNSGTLCEGTIRYAVVFDHWPHAYIQRSALLSFTPFDDEAPLVIATGPDRSLLAERGRDPYRQPRLDDALHWLALDVGDVARLCWRFHKERSGACD